MSQSNDWDQTPQHEPPRDQGPADQPPSTSVAGGMHPLADHEFDVGFYFETLKLALMRLKEGPVLKAVALLSIPALLWALLEGGVHSIGVMFGVDLFTGLLIGAMSILLIPVWIAINALQLTLYRPGSHQFFTDQVPARSPVELVKEGVGDFVKALVTYLGLAVATTLGAFCCLLPGLVAAFFLGQAPYLAIVRGHGIGEAFSGSIDRAKNHWHVMVMGIGTMLVFAVATGIVMAILGGGAWLALVVWQPLGLMAQAVVQWLGILVYAIGAFVITLTTFGLIDELEGLDEIAGEPESF